MYEVERHSWRAKGGDVRLAVILASADHRPIVILAPLNPRPQSSSTTEASSKYRFCSCGTPRRCRTARSSSEHTLSTEDRGGLANPRHHVVTHLYGSLREHCNLFGKHDRRINNRQPGMSFHGNCVLGCPLASASVEARFKLTLGPLLPRHGSSTSSCRHQHPGMHVNNSARSAKSLSSSAR